MRDEDYADGMDCFVHNFDYYYTDKLNSLNMFNLALEYEQYGKDKSNMRFSKLTEL